MIFKFEEKFRVYNCTFNVLNRHEIVYKNDKTNLVLKNLTLLSDLKFGVSTKSYKKDIFFAYSGNETYVFSNNFKTKNMLFGHFLSYIKGKTETFYYDDLNFVINVFEDDKLIEKKFFSNTRDFGISRVCCGYLCNNYKNHHELKLFSFDAKENWHIDIRDFSEIKLDEDGRLTYLFSCMQEYENTILLPYRTESSINKACGLISIDLSNGSLKFLNSDFYYSVNSIYEDYLYFIEDSIGEIDLRTGSITKYYKLNELVDSTSKQIASAFFGPIHGITVTKKYILFSNRGLLFVLDRNTFKLLEIFELSSSESIHPNAPVYKDGYLYILDGDDYVHILKDETFKDIVN